MRQTITKFFTLIFLIGIFNPIQAKFLEDYEAYGGLGFEYISTYSSPATTLFGGIGGYLAQQELENVFLEVGLSQSVLPAWAVVNTGKYSSFNTHLSIFGGYMYIATDLLKFKPKLGFDVEFATIARSLGFKMRYGLTSYYYLENMNFDIYIDFDQSFSFFTSTTSTRLMGGVQFPVEF